MKWRYPVLLLLLAMLCIEFSAAQYYSWGPSPASVKWRKLKTPDVKLIYPADYETNARRALWYMDTVRTHIDFGYRHGTMRTPSVIHTRNMIGNGMVMWAPRRIELIAAPEVPYSEPWLKQLVFHEYRHNVQFNNLRRGTNRVLTWFLGEQIAFLGVGQFSIYITEGDAVMAETELSAFGRGLQPSWTMHYRAMRDVGSRNYSADYWFSGSYRDFVPDHYRVGYQMVRWSYDHFGKFIWDDIARYVSRNPQTIMPTVVGLRKLYGLTPLELFRRTFADLNAHWDSLSPVEDSSTRIATPETSYTTYRWPLWFDDGTLVAFKEDFDRPSRIVKVDVATGREKTLAYTGPVSSRPVLRDGKLLWTEYRQSLLWDEKTNSRLRTYDLRTGRRATSRGIGQVFYPVHTKNGTARVDYDHSGRFSIRIEENYNPRRIDFPHDIEIAGLTWDDTTDALYFIGLDDAGMFLGKIGDDESVSGWHRLTPSRHITISDLRAVGGRLYFGSIVSGKDEAHAYDLASGTEYRLSESAYGSFQPSLSPDGTRIALTTYDRRGYHIAVQDASIATPQRQRTLPVDLVNPAWKRWDMPKMDSLVFSEGAAEQSQKRLKPRWYNRFSGIFRPHSWLPMNFYPPAAIQETDLTMTLGATVLSQSLLSDAASWLSYGWSPSGDSMVRGGLSYNGLGPVINVDFTWGGARQALYGPQNMMLAYYPAVPAGIDLALKPYFSISTSLSLPMVVSSGYWYGALTPSVEYFYSNGLILRPDETTRTASLVRGVERLSFGAAYSGQARMARKEFLPRWGVAVRAGYAMNPTNNDFRSYWSAFVRTYLPGIVRPHSTTLRFAWQQTVGSGDLMFHSKEVFPRGAVYNFATRRWVAGSLDYQLPVWYPEGGIPSIIYFKRVRINLFADYARWQDLSGEGEGVNNGGKWHPLFSYGGDIILDVNPFRLPGNSNVSLRMTIAKPSDDDNLFFGFGMEVPL